LDLVNTLTTAVRRAPRSPRGVAGRATTPGIQGGMVQGPPALCD